MGARGDFELEVRLLGPVEVRADGELIELNRLLERALAARLALAHGRGVLDEVLAQDLWGAGVERPRERLRVLAHRLRRSLGTHAGALRRTPAGYALSANPVDLVTAERAVVRLHEAVRAEDIPTAFAAGNRALSQWRGPSLADLRTVPFATAEAARLDTLRLELQTGRLQAELELGVAGIADIDQLLAAHPLHEALVGLAATALYRSGRQAEALDRISQLRKSLANELAIDPCPEIAALELRLLRHDPTLMPSTAAAKPLPVLRLRPGNLIGRDQERASLIEELQAPGLRTLTGAPGVGKTRLAQEIASVTSVSGRPVAWVDLAPLDTPAAVIAALTAAAGIDGVYVDPLPRCAEALSGALLVIDNAEHLVDPVAAFLTGLFRHAQGISVLVTSQRPVRIDCEVLHHLCPLPSEDASRLFCGLTGTCPDEQVDTICEAVDRSPLAIELAAGLTRVLTVEQLSERIGQRLKLLTGGNRDSGARHSSLRNALEWSHSLLDPPSRCLLRRLSVFAGGCTLEAAEQIAADEHLDAADVPALLTDLVDRCLITADGHRFRLLETIRDFAHEKLLEAAEESPVRRRHADWCLAVAVDGSAAQRTEGCIPDVREPVSLLG